LHEIKLDGYRAISRVDRGVVEVFSRNDKDWTLRYRQIAEELRRLPVSSAILDGEVAVQLPDGTTSFQELQNYLSRGRSDSLLYFVFDLLFLDGYDLTGVPIEKRKAALKELMDRAGSPAHLRFVEDMEGDGARIRDQACELRLEGIVSKKAGSRYRPGVRGPEWLKTKCLLRQEFVIGGYTDPSGRRVGFGGLLIGAHEDGKLRYVGKVGTGYTDALLRQLAGRLKLLGSDEPPFELGLERAPRKAHWVRPELVAEVAFTEWTKDGQIRHPSFKGLREDKDPAPVVAERPDPEGAVAGDRRIGAGRGEKVLGVRLTNPNRVFWPAAGMTKKDLVLYYERMAERMIPYVIHRPVSMVRCPQGVAGVGPEVREDQGGPCFFHKHAGSDFPGLFERVRIEESGGLEDYLTITEPASLVALAQMGVLEIHIWGARWPDVERPDMVVFDLDPDPAAGFAGAVEGARLVRALLRGLGLESYVKTTGGKGLHVVVPIRPGENWEGVKGFAKTIADALARYAPDRFTSSMSKSRRKGKTFVDYLRNARTATSVAPFSTRAKRLPTVSVPLRWQELGRLENADRYTLMNLSARLERLRGDPWEGYFERQRTQALTYEIKQAAVEG
jgi:bifunctional non-homologous end joining protein LigD